MLWNLPREIARPRSGGATVEFAQAVAVYFMVILGGFQLSIIGVQYFTVMQVARDTARWAAINPDNVDSTIVAHAYTASTGLLGGGASGFASVTVSPSCTVLSGGRCTNRVSGQVLSVSIRPNVTAVLFIPASFNMVGLSLSVPTTLPIYTVSAMIE
ncbi:MAG: pilus assembly protein [Chloroflexi bacterium]|nr:pilus assembly protein [Chloroflexota bacterium]